MSVSASCFYARYYIASTGGSRICQGGDLVIWLARAEREYKFGSGVQPPVGFRTKPPEAESFLSIFIQKKWPKFKDLNENLRHGLRQTASCSHDQP